MLKLIILLQQLTLVCLLEVTNVRLSLLVLSFPLFTLLGNLTVYLGYLPHLLLHFIDFTSKLVNFLSKLFYGLLSLSNCLQVVINYGLLLRNDLFLVLVCLPCLG